MGDSLITMLQHLCVWTACI